MTTGRVFAPVLLGAVLLGTVMAGGAVAADAQKGAELYKANCVRCHATTKQSGTGPGLAGVHGAAAAASPDFAYSRALRRAELTWDDKTLEEYLADPVGRVPGNKMPYSGLPSAAERADVIAYLKTLK